MQTFLPYANFEKSASVLDMRRLGKQRLEALQILKVLHGQSSGWKDHPIVKMWRGHRGCLLRYAQAIIDEWVARGYTNNIDLSEFDDGTEVSPPEWLGDVKFHRSHQSNLLRKFPEHYSKYFKNVPDDLTYEWMTS